MDNEIRNDEAAMEEWVIVDPSRLQSETLERLAKEFILREYHDGGPAHLDIEAEIARVVDRLYNGDCLITFDHATQSVGVMLAEEFRKISNAKQR